MAQVEQYKGKLGFEHRSEEKLTLALTELLDTLEEFGHPAVQINARESHRIGLDCDHYRVTLRLRRIPLRLGVRSPVGVPAPAAYIELAMTPCFPAACDQEISEILLAVILKRLTEALDPLVIFWQETNHPLTPKQFIGAFAPQDVEPQPQQLLQAAPFELQSDTQDTLTEARVERLRARRLDEDAREGRGGARRGVGEGDAARRPQGARGGPAVHPRLRDPEKGRVLVGAPFGERQASRGVRDAPCDPRGEPISDPRFRNGRHAPGYAHGELIGVAAGVRDPAAQDGATQDPG